MELPVSSGPRFGGAFLLYGAMLPDLERVIALQKLDSTRTDAERRLAEEQERESLFNARIESARQRVTVTKEQLAHNQSVRRTIEKEVAVHQ